VFAGKAGDVADYILLIFDLQFMISLILVHQFQVCVLLTGSVGANLLAKRAVGNKIWGKPLKKTAFA
jgi:hypothetical protein